MDDRVRLDTPGLRITELTALIAEIEDAFPVDTWTVDGLSIWPLLRHRIAFALDAASVSGAAAHRARSLTAKASRATRSLTGLARRSLLAHVLDREHELAPDTRVDLLFLGDTVSCLWFDGGWYEYECEPVISAASRLGLRSALLMMGHRYRHPRHHPSRFVEVALDLRRARAVVSRTRPAKVRLDGIESATLMLERRGFSSDILDPVGLISRVRLVEAFASYLAGVLRRTAPRACLVPSYGAVPMALHLACRRHGIPSVDVQHGVQGPAHWAYAGWNKVPAGGYPLLPSVYWTWRESDAGVIRAWADRVPGGPAVIVGGNAWLEAWRSPGEAAVRTTLEEVASLVVRHKGNRHILVTLQTGLLGDGFLTDLVAAVARAPEGWRWWVRTRATMARTELDSVHAALGGARTVTVEEPSRLPLHALLAQADAHLTVTSSTVIEAEAFAVPSVVTGADASVLFPEHAHAGWLVQARGPEDLVASLDLQMGRRRSLPRLWPPPTTGLPEALATILSSADRNADRTGTNDARAAEAVRE